MPYDRFKDPEARRAYMKAWREGNDEKIKADRRRRWREDENYRARVKESSKRSYARKCIEFDAVMAELKHSGCLKCGEKEVVALDFHHLNPSTKTFYIGGMRRFMHQKNGIERLRKEVEGCVLLCVNCHRKLHAGRISLDG